MTEEMICIDCEKPVENGSAWEPCIAPAHYGSMPTNHVVICAACIADIADCHTLPVYREEGDLNLLH